MSTETNEVHQIMREAVVKPLKSLMRQVVSYERRANNVSEHTVAHLECGHERVFEYGHYPTEALCWVCTPEDQIPTCDPRLDSWLVNRCQPRED
jgi:hypothetical protein